MRVPRRSLAVVGLWITLLPTAARAQTAPAQPAPVASPAPTPTGPVDATPSGASVPAPPPSAPVPASTPASTPPAAPSTPAPPLPRASSGWIGIVVDATTGAPLEAVSILSTTGDFVITDVDGNFNFQDDPGVTITVIAQGYKPIERRIRSAADLRFRLIPISGGEIINIVAKAPEQAKPIAYTLSAEDIRSLPGAGNDILRAVQSLPGVARIPFNFGGLVLRGMSPRDTNVYLDGIEVPLAFHFGGVTSFYPGGMLDTLAVTPGGFDASYGRTQGGVVELTTRQPRTDRWHLGGEIGLLHSAIQAEGPIWGQGGIIIGFRRSYLDAIVRPFVAADTMLPSYYDAQIRGSWGDARRKGLLTVMLFGALDNVANDRVSVTSGFARLAAVYLKVHNAWTVRVMPWLGANTLSFTATQTDSEQESSLTRPGYPGGVRTEVGRQFAWGQLRTGVDVLGGYLDATAVRRRGRNRDNEEVTESNNSGSKIWWADVGLWLEAHYKGKGNRWSVKPGLRLETFGMSRQVVLDPRLNLHQSLTPKLTLRQAIGRYHQPPLLNEVDPAEGNPDLKSSYTDQVSFGVEHEFPGEVKATVTGYFYHGRSIPTLAPKPDDPDGGFGNQARFGGLGPTFFELLEKQIGAATYRANTGKSRTRGVEISLKRDVGKWVGFLGYTLSRSERQDDPAYRSADTAAWHPYLLDQTHHLTVLGSYKFDKWRFGARTSLVTGNPYSRAYVNDQDELVQQPYSGRLPMFFSLDVRADRTWQRSWGRINFYADIQNVTNHTNIEARETSYEAEIGANGLPTGRKVLGNTDTVGLPILPFIGVEFIPTK